MWTPSDTDSYLRSTDQGPKIQTYDGCVHSYMHSPGAGGGRVPWSPRLQEKARSFGPIPTACVKPANPDVGATHAKSWIRP